MSDYTETFTQVNGDVADASALETEFDAIATAVNSKLDADGSGVMTGALAMGTNKITGLGDPTAAQDAATFNVLGVRQVQVATSTTDDQTSSTSFVSSSLSDSITPLYSDSKIIIFVSAGVRISHDLSGPAGPLRNATYEIYRSSGSATQIIQATVGQNFSDNSQDQRTSANALFLMGTETPGAGTHTYVLRHKTASTALDSDIRGSSDSQAVMVIAEVKP